jgi:hypothetical protein
MWGSAMRIASGIKEGTGGIHELQIASQKKTEPRSIALSTRFLTTEVLHRGRRAKRTCGKWRGIKPAVSTKFLIIEVLRHGRSAKRARGDWRYIKPVASTSS